MSTETERRSPRVESSESRHEPREASDRTQDTGRTLETPRLRLDDTSAIVRARERALASGESVKEPSREEEKSLLEELAQSRVGKVGIGTAKVFGASFVVFTYLGYQTSRPVFYTTARVLDWLGHKMNSWADKLIDKKMPVLSWILNPVISFLDTSAKSLGIDKTLGEHLKKNAEDRKKVAEKVLKDFREAEKKHEKKHDDEAKKKGREKKLKEILPPEAAEAILGEMNEIESKETPAPAPAAEAPKVA